MLSLGVLLGFLWIGFFYDTVGRKSRTTGSLMRNPIDVGILILVTGLIGARLGYVFSHYASFSAHPLEIPQFWKGGLSWIGAAAGILVGLLIFSIVTHSSFWEAADVIAIPAAIIIGLGWMGCMLDGCAYGLEVQWDLDFLRSPDLFGVEKTRWPAQMLGIILSAVLVYILFRVDEKKRLPGSLFLISTLGLMVGITIVNFTRGDPAFFIYGVRSDTFVAALLIFLTCAALIVRRTGLGGS